MSNKSCTYVNGVVSALSNSLITKETFLRLIEAKSYKEFLTLLQETPFYNGSEEASSFDLQNTLIKQAQLLAEFVKRESPTDEFVNFFLLPYDYMNIANFCKCQISNQEFEKFVDCEGIYSLTQIKDYILSKKYNNFNNEFIEKSLKDFEFLIQEQVIDTAEIDTKFKIHMYENLLKVCSKNKILKNILCLQIDVENISVAMRAKTQFELEHQLIDGGEIAREDLIKIFKKDKSVLAKITNKKLYAFVKLAFSENKLESFVNFEVNKNNLIVSTLANKLYEINTIEPFILYCYKKQIEIKNIRLIASYIENNLNLNIKKRILGV